MRLCDLKTGYVVELRNGDRMMVLRDFCGISDISKNVFLNITKQEWDRFDSYDENMKYYRNSANDIVKVMKMVSPIDYDLSEEFIGRIVWTREEQREENIDWSKIERDTPIYVKDGKTSDWKRAHFAEYIDGKVYAYIEGKTSHTTCITLPWKYAKLKENE